jgi:glycerol-3-phosphate acyltransferase PlsY
MTTAGLMAILGGYLLGAVPFGILTSRLWGAPDPREGGSRNIGATNVGRLAGKAAGVVTLLLDVAKGAVPAYLTSLWAGPDQLWLPPAVGLAAFIGHCWPVYLRFKGGKGVATAMGVFLAMAPAALLGVLGVFVLLTWKTAHVSVGSIGACSSAPLWMLMSGAAWPVTAMALVMAAAVVYRHRENIARLRRNAEHGWR